MSTNGEQLRAVIFDLDGTVINSIDHIVACWQEMSRRVLGREMSREEIVPTLGRALMECFEEIAPGRSDEMRAVYREHQRATHDDMVTLVAGTRETLGSLKSAGVKVAIATSKSLAVANEGLDLFGVRGEFDAVITYEDTPRHKPQPDPLLFACSRLGVSPQDALYVGDAVVDILAGRAAGMKTAGVTWGASNRELISSASPDYVIDDMRELAGIAGAEALA
jgi:pyrophosphatase PpaX